MSAPSETSAPDATTMGIASPAAQRITIKLDRPVSDLTWIQKSLLFAELSRLAYGAPESVEKAVYEAGLDQCVFIARDGAEGYVFGNRFDCMIVCRGTEPNQWNDIKADANAWTVVSEVGRVHSGFHTEVNELWPWHRALFLVLGLAGLMVVPIFKACTHLPPFMGMILSLGVLWVVSELVSHTMDDKTRSSTGVMSAIRRVDMASILFFLGILLAVGALGSVGILKNIAVYLQNTIGNSSIIAVLIGLVSAVVDNVPLVAGGIEMYDDTPANDSFWMLLAYCAGTGGSCLIIGSSAGVAAMGLEKIEFMWYARRIAPLALAGYFGGVAIYFLQKMILG